MDSDKTNNVSDITIGTLGSQWRFEMLRKLFEVQRFVGFHGLEHTKLHRRLLYRFADRGLHHEVGFVTHEGNDRGDGKREEEGGGEGIGMKKMVRERMAEGMD
jgi:hypothetical protein